MALHFDEAGDSLSTAEELEAWFDNVEVLDFFRVRPKVFLPPFGEDREENQAISKHQEGGHHLGSAQGGGVGRQPPVVRMTMNHRQES